MPPPLPDPTPDEDSLPLDHSHILLTSFNAFLTVAIHNILYYRAIYPPSTFLSTKAYNLPVHQNRHPKVCAWIRDAVDAVAAQLTTGHVSRVAIVIHSPLEGGAALNNPSPQSPSPSDAFSSTPTSPSQPPTAPLPGGTVLERWLIDTSRFPTWPSPKSKSLTGPPTAAETAKAMHDFTRVLARDARSEDARERHLAPPDPHPLNPSSSFAWADLDEQLRGALRRMASVAEGMGPLLPPLAGEGADGGGCTFTVAVELGEEGRAPIGHPQAWIPSEPNLQPKGKGREVAGEDIGGVRTRPIRAVEAGPLFFECWVEESKAKEVLRRMAEGGEGPTQSQGSTQPF
ncbi:DNA-binding protein [Parachaetomium inaequale]|uniref:DNA-binding protein n=1 Tax=Parachaetomium inaequale TaxID=2588326 RepID=A0AAN6P6X4_9PEZI|nr:DNA-binding protein [Parachaetomium inaequale]